MWTLSLNLAFEAPIGKINFTENMADVLQINR